MSFSKSKILLKNIFLFISILTFTFINFQSYFHFLGNQTTIYAYFLLSITIFYYFKFEISNLKKTAFSELIWRTFITSVVCFLAFTFCVSLLKSLPESKHKIFILGFIKTLLIVSICIFSSNGFFAFKKLLLYQKSKFIHFSWLIFEYSLIIGFIVSELTIFNYEKIYFFTMAFSAFMLFYLIFHQKWVAYLNFKSKIEALFFTFLISLVSILIAFYSWKLSIEPYVFGILYKPFIVITLLFVFSYSLVAFLVLVFNLPTSSVFEQKFEEIVSMHRLSDSLQKGKSEEQVYEVLLNSSISAVLADAGWIEIYPNEKEEKIVTRQQLYFGQVEEIKQITSNSLKLNLKSKEVFWIKSLKNEIKSSYSVIAIRYESFLSVPLIRADLVWGRIILVRETRDGFDKELIDIVINFCNQACISIDNFKLIQEAVTLERFKEEMQIAKDVQKRLIKEDLGIFKGYSLSNYSVSADLVGGDFYDICKINETQSIVLIGDVSGKGTSAAFNMAVTMGALHAMVVPGVSTALIAERANMALSASLEKASFVTLSVFIIDIITKNISFTRAGHCPGLLFRKCTNQVEVLNSKGMGLGIIRNNKFNQHIDTQNFNYEPGDILLLYTDGVIEIQNEKGEWFETNKLIEFLNTYATLDVIKMKERLKKELEYFSGNKEPKDDLSFLILKFN